MEQGLAAQMVYGNGTEQNTTHYYAGADKLKKNVKKKIKKCNYKK
jgi:hypothetical protein